MALTAEVVFIQVPILLSVAVASQLLFKRLRQPTVIGEIAIGVLLGPTIGVPLLISLGYLGAGAQGILNPELIVFFATLGSIVLLFSIGLETDIKAVYRGRNFVIALGGVAVPWVLGFGVAYLMVPDSSLLTSRFVMAMFVGATLVTTSTAIAGAIMLDLKMIRSKVAQAIMGAVIVDDILGLLVLSMALGMAGGGGVDPVELGKLVVISIVFIALALYLGTHVFAPFVLWMHRKARKVGSNAGFTAAMVIAFSLALLSEVIGLSAIVGAFLAGAMFSRSQLRHDFEKGVQLVGAIFTPVFFISLGLLVNAWTVGVDLLAFGAVLVAAAFVSKLVGCGFMARLTGMSRKESLAVGYGMIPRGEVGLIAAVIGQQQGLIGPGLFSILVVVTLLVSVLPMPLLRRALIAIGGPRTEVPSVLAAGTEPS